MLITAITITAFNGQNPGFSYSTSGPAGRSANSFQRFSSLLMANRSLPLTMSRAYTRTDFTTLRAFVQRRAMKRK